ncbi:hypothetical protein [Streptomyces sp. ML-6]|nr:hypothetical protein [Streptomyces sp. ML-6]MDK0524775.1 hypothetical protein [Streptomyces sp. ML-6]
MFDAAIFQGDGWFEGAVFEGCARFTEETFNAVEGLRSARFRCDPAT